MRVKNGPIGVRARASRYAIRRRAPKPTVSVALGAMLLVTLAAYAVLLVAPWLR